MQQVTLDGGETVEVRNENEPIPDAGGLVKCKDGHVRYVSVKDGITTSATSVLCLRVEAALAKKRT